MDEGRWCIIASDLNATLRVTRIKTYGCAYGIKINKHIRVLYKLVFARYLDNLTFAVD